MAIVQIRHDTRGRAYFRRRVAAGKPRWRRCERSNDDCPMWYIGSSWPTRVRRAREDTGGDYDIQRGRPNPDGRLFGPVTARSRHRANAPRPRQPISGQGHTRRDRADRWVPEARSRLVLRGLRGDRSPALTISAASVRTHPSQGRAAGNGRTAAGRYQARYETRQPAHPAGSR